MPCLPGARSAWFVCMTFSILWLWPWTKSYGCTGLQLDWGHLKCTTLRISRCEFHNCEQPPAALTCRFDQLPTALALRSLPCASRWSAGGMRSLVGQPIGSHTCMCLSPPLVAYKRRFPSRKPWHSWLG